MNKNFPERLSFCLETGKITLSDLSLWMGKSPTTIRMWVYYNRTPMSYYREEAERRLSSLEKAIEDNTPLIPLNTSVGKRNLLLKEIMNDYLPDSFSKENPTG